MKMKKILALLLALVMVVGVFAGCEKNKDTTGADAVAPEVKDAVTKESIESDTKVTLEEALKKSLAQSPLKDLHKLTAGEATGIKLIIDAAEAGKIDTNVVFANEKLCALLGLDVTIEGQPITGEIFVDEENFAIKSDLLGQIFGDTSMGVSLKDFETNFKESAWYDLLIVQSGLEAELEEEASSVDFKGIMDAYKKYFNTLKTLEDGHIKYAVEEVTVKIGENDTKCFKVTETLDVKIADVVEKAMKDFMNDLSQAINEPIEEADIEEAFGSMRESIEAIAKIYSVDYVIDAKTGALLKIETAMEIKASDLIDNDLVIEEETADQTVSYKLEVDFGEKPTETFAPTFKMVTDADGMKITIDGKVAADTEEHVFVIEATITGESTDEIEGGQFNLKAALNKDDTWQIKVWNEEEDMSIGGTFKIDGAKISVTIDTEELSEGELKSIELTIDLGAQIPTVFEYVDVLKWDEERVLEIVEMLNTMLGSAYENEFEDELVTDFDTIQGGI